MKDTSKIQLVGVQQEDCDLLFEWTNDEKVRENSFNSETVKYSDHNKWFNEKMNCPRTILLFLVVNNIKSGLVRLDEINNESLLINYSIPKEYRRKGYGTMLLELVKDKYSDKGLVGKVKKENIGSIKAFIKAGFYMKEEAEMLVFYSTNTFEEGTK
ncbi:GNAT family N-acetyltransferase [Alkalicella caledoniensis]|uniref:GNAT family N-acetyltransferase n=1 Tax=Alkalicella caledoniensis TaxID=2731377 RepID=A0A7G9W3Z8_ALKCA|nr:GNAT family N-acetyltransferase [Alkalicella caledoniensis]QNO13410.1 GNAT family N-acetyltransferase [Alkalicella caledoniensis]